MDASNDILFNAAVLHSLKRQQLIVLCKRYKVKASGKNDDIVARLQTYGQSLFEDSKASPSASAQDSSGCHLTSKSDDVPRAENVTAVLAAADASADTTANATIKVPEFTLNASSKDGTDSKRPNPQWDIVEGEVDEAEFGGLKISGSTESITSKSITSHVLTIGSVSGKSTKSSTSKGNVISSSIMSIAKSIKSVASKGSFKSSSLGSGSQPAAPAHCVLARTTTPSADIFGSALGSGQQLSALNTATDERQDSFSKPIVESKVDAGSASNGEATIRLVTTSTGGSPLVREKPAATTETVIEAEGERPMDIDLSSTGLTSPVTKPTKPSACVFGSPTAGISNTQFGNAAALVLEEMNRRLGISSGGAKVAEDGEKVEFGILPGLNVDVSKTLEKLRVVKKDEGRFASVHEKEFAKMDSIANHYSVRRPLERIAGKKRKSMEGVSHHDTLVPLKDHTAKGGPTAKRQKTGDASLLSRKASTSSLVAKGKELPPKSQDKGTLLKKAQRDRERERRRCSRVSGGVRRPFVSGVIMSKPRVATNTSAKLGLLRSGAAKIRSMLGSTPKTALAAGAAAGTTTPATTKIKAKVTATTCAHPPTSTGVPAAMDDKVTSGVGPKGRKTPGPTSRPNFAVPKAGSSSTAVQPTSHATGPSPRKLAVPPTTSQTQSASAAGFGVVKCPTSNGQQCSALDKADIPTPADTLTVKSPIVAPCAQVLMPSAASGHSNTSAQPVVGSAKQVIQSTPRSQRTSRLYTPTASSLARMAATNAKYRRGKVLPPSGASNFCLDIAQENVGGPSPTKTTTGQTPAPMDPTHTLPAIISKTPHKPLLHILANSSTAEVNGVSPVPAPPAHLSKTNTLTPLRQSNRPRISRSKIIAKVEEQRTAAAASSTSNYPGKMPRKSVAAGAGAVAKAAAMGETPQEYKSARVQVAFERRVRLSEAAIRRSRTGRMPVV